jgi:hypothetical protein
MITLTVTAQGIEELYCILDDLLFQIDASYDAQDDEEVFEYDEEGYLYDEVEDELYWVDFATGQEFFYNEETDEWLECDELMEFENEVEESELDIEDDFAQDSE